jgi:protein-L-isoaspartate(D-aspartate) O-methyltransferase
MRCSLTGADKVAAKFSSSARRMEARIPERRCGRRALEISTARRAFAEELRFVAHVRSDRVIRAFATVPREHFLGPRPWLVDDLAEGYWQVAGNDPADAYHNVLFALDPDRNLNNGQPEFWARLLDRLELRAGDKVFHVGAGTGYYTAIIAELVGPEGAVIAAEIDPALAARARANLADRGTIQVVEADGTTFDPGPVNAIVVNAGTTQPLPIWLDALMPEGRMLLPLTTGNGMGTVFRIERIGHSNAFAAKSVSGVKIYPCAGAREECAMRRLSRALGEGGQRFVRSLRRDTHTHDETCWLHGDGYCLSTVPAA